MILQGFGVDLAATTLDVYAGYQIDGDRDPNVQYKISDEPMPAEKAVAEARERLGWER